MKIIPNQKITGAKATSESLLYPALNVLDENPKRVWQAESGVYTSRIDLPISEGSAGLAIFNTNATSVAVRVAEQNFIEWEAGVAWETGTVWSAQATALVELVLSLDGVSGSAWVEWVYSTIALEATLTLTCASTETLFLGVAVSDKVYTYKNPNYGVREGIHSYSIVRELQNGAMYRKERDKVRTFDFTFTEDRSVDFYEFMYSVAEELGYKPAAWWIADGIDDYWWVVYARFSNMPEASHSWYDHSKIKTKLIEVL